MTTTSTDTLPAGHWTVDPARSEVAFETRAMGGLFPVHGRFERFTGALNVDEQGHVDGDFVIEADFVVDHDASGLGWAKPVMVRKRVDARVRLTLHK
jgi:hypothetical protein